MLGLTSRFVIFMLRHRHWLRLQSKPKKAFDKNTPIGDFRQRTEKGTKLFGKIPDDVEVLPVKIDSLYAEWIIPAKAPKEKVILYFHGGGYVSGNCHTHRTYVAKVAQETGIRALLFEYRLAPEHPFPAGLDDAITVYTGLLSQGVLPSDIVFMGDSAGGGLSLATLIALRDKDLPLPSATVALSPWTDLKCTGESLITNEKLDPFTPRDSWSVFSDYYVGNNDPCLPWISPLYGDLQGLPAVLIYAGGHEVLVDDSTRFAEKAKHAGVDVTLHIGEGMFHCYPVFASLLPEAQQAMAEICTYIKTRLTLNPVTTHVPMI
ncbi:MAG: alpha/beta hydrolase [Anaerolineae bacterium]|nr:alpha/beta hydrolase [Anaerolineae bacterium]